VHRRKHAAHDEEHENHERWLLTYADLITLLLALFMMLYAMSVLDLRKYQAFQEAFTQGLGGHKTKANDIAPETKNPITIPSATPQPETKNELDQEDLKKLKKKLEKQLKDAGLQDEVQLELQSRGLVMNVVSGVLFDTASADLTKNGKALLKSLDVVFASFDNKLVVEGHTDPRPISSSVYPSNWELSTARATAVLRDLIGEGIRDTRLSAAGYADTRPRASNATEEGMSRNRRVDIVVLAAPPKHPVAATSTVVPTTAPTTAPASSEEHGSGH
jgi:chemotaxis protein MotB